MCVFWSNGVLLLGPIEKKKLIFLGLNPRTCEITKVAGVSLFLLSFFFFNKIIVSIDEINTYRTCYNLIDFGTLSLTNGFLPLNLRNKLPREFVCSFSIYNHL